MLHDPISTPLLIPLPIPLPQQPENRPGPPSATQNGGAQDGLAGTQQPPSTGGNGQATWSDAWPSMLMLLPILALLFFMMIGPERKRRKETQQMLQALKPGDRVVTIGGMHGIVATIAEKTVTLRCDQLRMVFDRSAVARIERDEAPAQEQKKG